MAILPRPDAVATQRLTLRGSRAAIRRQLDEYAAAGTLFTYTDPVADPPRGLGVFTATAILISDPPSESEPARVIAGELVPVRAIARPVEPPAEPVRVRRARAVNRHTVIRTAEVGGVVVVAGGVGWLGYELVCAVIDMCVWIGAHGPMLLGAAVFLVVVLLAAGSAGCSMCGRR